MLNSARRRTTDRSENVTASPTIAVTGTRLSPLAIERLVGARCPFERGPSVAFPVEEVVGLDEDVARAVLGDGVHGLFVVAPLVVVVFVREFGARLVRFGDEQVDGLVDGVTTGLEDVVVLASKPVDESEIPDPGFLGYLSNRRLLEFLVPLDAAFGELPVPGAALQEEVLTVAPRVAKEDSPRARRFDCQYPEYSGGV